MTAAQWWEELKADESKMIAWLTSQYWYEIGMGNVSLASLMQDLLEVRSVKITPESQTGMEGQDAERVAKLKAVASDPFAPIDVRAACQRILAYEAGTQ